MPLANIAPTKTNLLRLRDDLRFARQGHELLDQKRNILIMELMALIDQTIDFQNRVETALRAAYAALERAALDMGRLKLMHCARAINMQANIELRTRRVMGVFLPVVDTSFAGHAPYYSPMGTSFWVDDACRLFQEALELLGKLAELKISVLRLAHEVRKTIRKVNALEKIAIPDISETLAHIESRLEESERDMFVLMKKVKSRLERKRSGAAAAQAGAKQQ